MRIGDIWKKCDAVARSLGARYPQAEFTCIRDVYGRWSYVLKGVSDSDSETIKNEILADEDLRPYMGRFGVRVLENEPSLAKTIEELRQPLAPSTNAFIVQRMFTNESWLRDREQNPREWPPVAAFYSFKGGVGRTTATAMTALTLARDGKRVVVIDLDLEAPGIDGLFFDVNDEEHKPRGGVVDYLVERTAIGSGYHPDIDDFVLSYTDPLIQAKGGSLLIVPAGRLDETYMERLGRVNLAELGRGGTDSGLRALIEDLLEFRAADAILVDCRTGFTDLGGLTLNGLSKFDILVFRAGESDRRYLPIVLDHIQRFRDANERSREVAEQLARSFLIVYTMFDPPPTMEQEYERELREYTSRVCGEKVFNRFVSGGYTYPDVNARDLPLEPVPHDFIRIRYNKNFVMTTSAADMLRLQEDSPDDRPYESLVRRLLDVKQLLGAAPAPAPTYTEEAEAPTRQQVLSALMKIADAPGGEEEFKTAQDFQLRFLVRDAYRQLLDPKAFVILGRKGAGKSALFQILTHGDVARALSKSLGLDHRSVENTRWEIGFGEGPDFPEPDDFARLLVKTGEDMDMLVNFWRSFAAYRLARALQTPLTELPNLDACIDLLDDANVQNSIRRWLESADQLLAKEYSSCCLSYDQLDRNVSLDSRKRGLLISALIEYWQRSVRRLPQIRAKVFLREDIWVREVNVTDKSKIRDGIDRGTIKWEAVDIYRAILKRIGHVAAVRELLITERLWRSNFDAMLTDPLGFNPPNDEDWVRSCIHLLAGETMAPGEWGYKKGYVYTWVIRHISDAEELVRPRNALLLFAVAAKLQRIPQGAGPLLDPRKFADALRGDGEDSPGQVSEQAVADLKQEYLREWSIQGRWLPETFKTFEKIWPIQEGAFLRFLMKEFGIEKTEAKVKIEQMSAAGLLERRVSRGQDVQLQIPDIYLFGLGLTRKG